MAFLDLTGLTRFKNKIQDLLDGKKGLQSSVSSPAANGSAAAFIDTITQDAQGVISATKKNVYGSDIALSDTNAQKVGTAVEAIQDWKPASNGTSGQVLRSKGDGTTEWAAGASQSEINTAVDTWMGSHMSPNQTISLDNSLTSTTSAAQAAAAGNMVLVTDTQPSASTNKIWLQQTPDEEISIPTMDEFDDLTGDLVISSDTEPTEEFNRIWLKPTSGEVAVPTYDEFSDLKSAIDSTETYGLAHEMITLPFTIDRTGYISINTGKRSDSSESSITNFINIDGCDYITYKRQGTTLSSTVVAGIAFYRSNDTDTFISGVKSATGQAQKGYLSEPYTVAVPDGAKYVRFTTYTDTGTYGFFEASVQGALYTSDRKSLIYRGLLDENDDMNSLENAGVYLVKNYGTAHPPVNFPNLSGEFRILVIKNVTNLSHHGSEAQLVFFSGGIMYRRCDRNGETWSTWKTIYAVESETESDPLYELSKQLGLHTVPKNYGVLNAIRRARQLTDVKWTPNFDITRIFVGMRDSLSDPHGAAYYGLFKSDTEYKGAPYHSGAKYIGIDASIDAFITSAENINSVIGTGQSEASPADRLSYYGTACDTLVSYVYYLPHVQAGYFETLNGLSLIATISANFDYSKIELADLLFSTSHVAIISDIVKDENGNVIYIEVSDAARSGVANRKETEGKNGGICKRVMFTPTEFETMFNTFKLYRYANVGRTPYTPNRYSPMVNEGRPLAYHYLPCQPYEGEMAAYPITTSAPTVKILIDDDTQNPFYTHMIVYKDGVQWNHNGTSDMYPIDNTYIDIPCPQEESLYSAKLARVENGSITETSVSCHWVMKPYLNPSITINGNTAHFTITTKSTRFKPLFVAFGSTKADAALNAHKGIITHLYDGDYTVTHGSNGYTYEFDVPYPSENNTSYQFGMCADGIAVSKNNYNV